MRFITLLHNKPLLWYQRCLSLIPSTSAGIFCILLSPLSLYLSLSLSLSLSMLTTQQAPAMFKPCLHTLISTTSSYSLTSSFTLMLSLVLFYPNQHFIRASGSPVPTLLSFLSFAAEQLNLALLSPDCFMQSHLPNASVQLPNHKPFWSAEMSQVLSPDFGPITVNLTSKALGVLVPGTFSSPTELYYVVSILGPHLQIPRRPYTLNWFSMHVQQSGPASQKIAVAQRYHSFSGENSNTTALSGACIPAPTEIWS